ncbi:MAG: UDP-N-acetylmuramoyl-tripeptide--D-alanyl-D-alanine ligase [Lysobacteraceae bacterium]
MRPLRLAQIARWCEARLIDGHAGAASELEIDAVRTDTRTLDANDAPLYVALRGERFDGHDFIVQAQANGTRALLVSRPVDSDLPQLLCGDTQAALGEIAAGAQQGRDALVIALTGSNGKTSVKTLLHGILAEVGRTYTNPGNRNNEIGLPLAVLDAPEDAEFSIFEMGAGKPGDIAYLTSIVQPRIALVNNIAPAHLERMGTLLGVAQTKGAIYDALPDDGIAVVNADDAFAPYFIERLGARRVLRFGMQSSADVLARDLRSNATGSHFLLHTPYGGVAIELPLPGRHNVMNALAAATLALAAGASLQAIRVGLEGATSVAGRQVAHQLGNGAVLIDDSYNANPGSVDAAIAALAAGAGEPWLVLGDMAELGEGAELLHAQVGELARTKNIARLFTTGSLSRAATRAFGEGARHFNDKQSLIDALRDTLHGNVRVLVKGSRSSAMDEVVAALLADQSLQALSTHDSRLTNSGSAGGTHAA